MTMKISSIQALFDLSKKTFSPSATPPPSSLAIQKISSLMDTIGPADVGLRVENSEDDRGHGFFGLNRFNRVARWAQPITYVDIYECDSFTMCIFCLPSSSVIPLHDHPGMTVLSKVLYGSMHVKAYDWVEPMRIQRSKGPGYYSKLLQDISGCQFHVAGWVYVVHDSQCFCIEDLSKSDESTTFAGRLAKMVADRVVTPESGTSILYPKTGGNLHCFTAVTSCAVLDILAPPYLEAAGRKCTYYSDYPYSITSRENETEISGDGKGEEYAWLIEMGTPPDLSMHQGTYSGPAIQV
ncbi:Cysteine oxygenase/2-aminoethanethiol dioxygenase [Dillenia turbinata]|uniref:cysteine dioxygenase n=1 Tax=Dillenia turbinata TaxID=194707 RepID=A0AAN8Z1I5_9MAGN